MNSKVEKEWERLSVDLGEKVNKDFWKKTVLDAVTKLINAGFPKKYIKKMLETAYMLGDFGYLMARLPEPTFQEYFSGPFRKYGLDGSVDSKYGGYGGSTMPGILNISPYNSSIDVYEAARGKKEKSDPAKEDIFFAGHQIEPVYRNFFARMFEHRYLVFECDIQFRSKVYGHCLANADGFLIDLETGEFGILEIKHTSARNINFIKEFQGGHCPEYWDAQVQTYMKVLGATFACVFLGWGNRPGLDTNSMIRIEANDVLSETMLEQAEDFMENNVEKGVKPTVKTVKKRELAKKAIENLYGPVQASKAPVDIEKKLLPALEALEEAQAKVKEAADKEKEAKKAKEKLQEEYEALQLPLIEALKNSPKGVLDVDGKHYEVTYDVKNALDVEKVKDRHPHEYEECNKLAIDTEKLKKEYPDIYSECFGPKIGSARSFGMRVWEDKRR